MQIRITEDLQAAIKGKPTDLKKGQILEVGFVEHTEIFKNKFLRTVYDGYELYLLEAQAEVVGE